MTLINMKFDARKNEAFSSAILDLLEELGYDAWSAVDPSDRFILAHIGFDDGTMTGTAAVTSTNSRATFDNARDYIHIQRNEIDFLKNMLVQQQTSQDNKHLEECCHELQDEPLDEFHWHEMMDRISMMNNILSQNILDHACMGGNKKLDKQLEKAARALANAYQIAARLRFDITHKIGE